MLPDVPTAHLGFVFNFSQAFLFLDKDRGLAVRSDAFCPLTFYIWQSKPMSILCLTFSCEFPCVCSCRCFKTL